MEETCRRVNGSAERASERVHLVPAQIPFDLLRSALESSESRCDWTGARSTQRGMPTPHQSAAPQAFPNYLRNTPRVLFDAIFPTTKIVSCHLICDCARRLCGRWEPPRGKAAPFFL